MIEEEFTVIRQMNEQMLTIGIKACENLCEKRAKQPQLIRIVLVRYWGQSKKSQVRILLSILMALRRQGTLEKP